MSLVEISSRLVDAVPENHEAITEIITARLKVVGCYGQRPTDLDAVLREGEMTLLEPEEGRVKAFLSLLDERMRRRFRQMGPKFRGAFGFRDRTIYIPKRDKAIYEVFPKAHEITHGLLPWHDTSFLDSVQSLKPEFKLQREREANFGAGELIFQGDSFLDRVMGNHESLDSALIIADEFGATAASTFWRYAQVHDRPVALLIYDAKERKIQRAVASHPFRKKWSCMLVPERLKTEHEWVQAPPSLSRTNRGDSHLACDSGRYKVEWQSWKNRYTISVLLVAPSRLHTVGNLVRDFKSLVGG